MDVLDQFSLTGKVAIVTGASSGLGAAFAAALAGAGADVALGARRTEKLEATKVAIERLGRRCLAMRTDVTDPNDCEELAAATFEEFGRIDILVNCAGMGTAIPSLRETPEQFRSVIDTNLMGAYWTSQACARRMSAGASIINVSSVIAFTSVGLPQAAYTASKAALVGLTRDLAQQWSGRKGIRVNAIAPGYFLTEMTEEMDSEYMRTLVERRVPLGRTGELEECAAAVVFLASDAASYITGICLPIDGGLLTS
jgi:NAD(P)-dependent dehydrogenase (short-subunit alcohol dehydrogenase family)